MSTATPRAYSYIRFSTPEQLKGDSLRRQLELSARYAKENGLVLDEQLKLWDPGVSAFDKSNLGSRGKLREFLDAADQGRVPPGSFLLVESLDRLSRAEIYDALRTFLGILQKGITIVTLADGMKYAGGSGDANQDFTSLVVSIAVMARAHEESLTKSRRLRAAWSAKRSVAGERKLTAQCPAWVRLAADRRSFELIPERVAVVRQIIDLVRSGLGKRAIAKRLNTQGIPTIGPPKRRLDSEATTNPDRSWYESYIAKILRNRALVGEFQPHSTETGKRVPTGEPVRDYFPRVLADEEFALLQDLISERGHRMGGNRGRSFGNLFTGLVKCGYCGGSMVYVNKGEDRRGGGIGRGNRFLVCHKAKRGAGCHHMPWHYADFEASFLAFATRVDFEKFVVDGNEAGARLRAASEALVIERAKQAAVEVRLKRLVEAIAGAQAQPQIVLEKILELEEERGEIDRRVRTLESDMTAISTTRQASGAAVAVLRQVAAMLDSKSGEELFLFRTQVNEHLRRVLDRIVLYPGGTYFTSEDAEHYRAKLVATGRFKQAEVDKFVAALQPRAPRKGERVFAILSRGCVDDIIYPKGAVPSLRDLLDELTCSGEEPVGLTGEPVEAAGSGESQGGDESPSDARLAVSLA